MRHEGIGLPLRRSQVDTDQILPSRYLKRLTRSGYEDGLFAAWRASPEFVLNRPAFTNATVMVAGPDFGIGSSREAAVWALQNYGFRVVIAPRFGDIFRTNAGKSGLLVVLMSEARVERLWAYLEASPGATVLVDLERCLVSTAGGFEESFTVDADTRWRLLNGLAEIDITMKYETDITDFETRRPAFKPSVTL